jgi:hypothetical protein
MTLLTQLFVGQGETLARNQATAHAAEMLPASVELLK